MTRPSQTPYGQAVMDGANVSLKRNSVPWLNALIAGYEAKRSEMVEPWWDAIENLYECRQFEENGWNRPEEMGGRLIEPPRVYGLTHLIESIVYNRSPKIFVKPNLARTEELAKWAEEVSNTEWQRNYQLNREMRLCIRDCAKTGWGIMLTSYEGDFDAAEIARRKRQRLAKRARMDPLYSHLGRDEYFDGQGRLGPQAPESMTGVENDDRVMIETVSSRRIDPRLFMTDPERTCMEDVTWVGRTYYASYDSVMSKPWYRNKRNLRPTGMIKAAGQTTGDEATVQPLLYLKMREIFVKDSDGTWDLKEFADGHDQFLREVTSPYWLGNPYAMLRWNETGNRIWAISDIQPAYSMIMEERAVRTRLYDAIMREATDLNLCNGDVIGEDDVFPIIDVPGVGQVIRLTNIGDRPLESLFTRIRKDEKLLNAMNHLSILQKEIQDAIGLGPNQQLAPMKSETSATEAGIVDRMSQARGQAKHVAAEEFAATIAHQRLKLMAQYYSEDRIEYLAGPDAAKAWRTETFTRNDVQAGIAVTVEQGSMQPQSDERRIAILNQLMQEGLQFPLAATMTNMMEIEAERLRVFGIKDGSKLLNPHTTPDLVQEGAMQMGLMGMEGGASGASGGGSATKAPAQPSGEAGMAQVMQGAA